MEDKRLSLILISRSPSTAPLPLIINRDTWYVLYRVATLKGMWVAFYRKCSA